MEMAQWIVGRDTGTSSKVIWSVMNMVTPDYQSPPSDPDDFGRCYRLLKAAPAHWRKHLGLVSQTYPEWSALVREWDTLTEMYERVIGPTGEGWNVDESKAMYARMNELEDEGRIAAGWTRTSPNSWTGPKRQSEHRLNATTRITFHR